MVSSPENRYHRMGKGQKLGSGGGFQASMFSHPHEGVSVLRHSWVIYLLASFLAQISEVKLPQSTPKKPSKVCECVATSSHCSVNRIGGSSFSSSASSWFMPTELEWGVEG